LSPRRRSVMFEKIGRLAEQMASNVSVSRRGFLGRLGRTALLASGVLGGLLILPPDAEAGRLPCGYVDGRNNKTYCRKGCHPSTCPDLASCFELCLGY